MTDTFDPAAGTPPARGACDHEFNHLFGRGVCVHCGEFDPDDAPAAAPEPAGPLGVLDRALRESPWDRLERRFKGGAA